MRYLKPLMRHTHVPTNCHPQNIRVFVRSCLVCCLDQKSTIWLVHERCLQDLDLVSCVRFQILEICSVDDSLPDVFHIL